MGVYSQLSKKSSPLIPEEALSKGGYCSRTGAQGVTWKPAQGVPLVFLQAELALAME